ncbi:MAG TPA: hypothetical protein PLM24_07865 [Methanothrix sp.]|nr:hypothetical protein [Methanothrix sp.]HPJ83645.1 hypothetical protein [Methanothrix sp.]HPR67031.1 hypothetical protein [Methanothrix sp.]
MGIRPNKGWRTKLNGSIQSVRTDPRKRSREVMRRPDGDRPITSILSEGRGESC